MLHGNSNNTSITYVLYVAVWKYGIMEIWLSPPHRTSSVGCYSTAHKSSTSSIKPMAMTSDAASVAASIPSRVTPIPYYILATLKIINLIDRSICICVSAIEGYYNMYRERTYMQQPPTHSLGKCHGGHPLTSWDFNVNIAIYNN